MNRALLSISYFAALVALTFVVPLHCNSALGQESFEDYLRKRLPQITRAPLADAAPIWIAKESRNKKVLIDDATGLVVPRPPAGKIAEGMDVNDPAVKQYLKDLKEYYRRRTMVLEARREHLLRSAKTLPALHDGADYVALKVRQWNDDIFWAPASKEGDYTGDTGRVTRAGDEIRAVFGPIPPFDVSTPTPGGAITRPDGSTYECKIFSLEVDGNQVELKPNTSVSGSPLQFEHRDVTGAFVKWTTTIDRCDKPSLAGGVTPCGTSSRIAVIKKGDIEWISLARKTKGVEPLEAINYWLPSDPEFKLLGHIGFNRSTGEVAFLGENISLTYRFDVPEIPPGGSGYGDVEGRSHSKTRYDGEFGVSCAACHDNKEPRTITPYIKQSRVGYFDTVRRDAYSVGSPLMKAIRRSDEPYRIVGSGFTSSPNQAFINDSRVIRDLNACTNCHDLTTSVRAAEGENVLTGTSIFASDSISRMIDLAPTQYNRDIDPFRTSWAMRTGDGKIQPWMCQGGNVLANSMGQPNPELSDQDQALLLDTIRNPPADAPHTYQPAPAPEGVLDDGSLIVDTSKAVLATPGTAANRDNDNSAFTQEVAVTWKYHNSFGGVPTRDDVRFHLAILEVTIPSTGAASPESAYPTLEQTRGVAAAPVGGSVFRDGDITVIKDISHAGHLRFTDPSPTTAARDYKVVFPVTRGKRYLIRLLSKRFTFDQISKNGPELGVKYSDYDNRTSVDIP